jgi:hypothetical protein
MLKQVAEKSKEGVEAVNQYIFNNWKNFSKEEKEALVLAYV